MSNESAAEQAKDAAHYIIAVTSLHEAKATAAQAMALVDLAESIRFAAILKAMTAPFVSADSMDAFKSMVAEAKALAEMGDQ